MKKYNISFILISIYFISACQKDASFIETECKILKHGALWIHFTKEQASRTVTINPKANLITFKGTTFQDMKWATEIDKVETFKINNENILSINLKNKDEFILGKVGNECKRKTGEHLGVLLQTI